MASFGPVTTCVLLVEDDAHVRSMLRLLLEDEDYRVVEAADGEQAIERFRADHPDLVVVDLKLPKASGFDVCRHIRASSDVPIIVVTAQVDSHDVVAALELGADDYVTKPFGMNELVARIRVALRHRLQQHGEKPIFQTGDLSVDLVKRIVKVEGKEVKLSPKEYDILRILVQHAGKVLTHHFLLDQVWSGSTDVQYLRVYVRQLRQKIEKTPDQPRYITTETGVGYRLREAE